MTNKEQVFIDPLTVKPLGVVQQKLILSYCEQLGPTFGMTREEMLLWFAWPIFNGAVLKPVMEEQKTLGNLPAQAKKIEEIKEKWKKVNQDCTEMLEKMMVKVNLGSYI